MTDTPLTDEAVRAYLTENPGFLDRCPEAMLTLAMPESPHGDGVVDIRDFAIRRLQEELRDLRDGTDSLIQTTRINMSLLKRTHQAVLTVLQGDERGCLGETVADDLPLLLDVDVAALRFENDGTLPPRSAPLATLSAGAVDRVAPRSRPIALRPQATGDERIFGGGAGLVVSDALARLEPGNGHPPGLLALGSRRPGAFDEDQASDLLSFVARIVEHCVRQWTFGDRPNTLG
ncbi:DUF484 family protein [Roseospira marina]|uniref:DUF484 family protein n=1 Tax=Roseospira marina TaxID=140057 RepID=UPI0014792184|nr:DUF484 family protein [Roseospira marina]MBB4315961.1 hypothetical protein [Roseospira marina]MBB5089169.1 hypothetical protein [Roseospira marina]